MQSITEQHDNAPHQWNSHDVELCLQLGLKEHGEDDLNLPTAMRKIVSRLSNKVFREEDHGLVRELHLIKNRTDIVDSCLELCDSLCVTRNTLVDEAV